MSEPIPIARGLEHHRAGRLDEAAAVYRQVLHEKPGHGEALYLLGLIALQRGRGAEAVQLAEQAIAANAQQPEPHNLRGQALLREGKPAEAVASFRQALAVVPGFAEAQYYLGASLLLEGRLDEAIAALEQALRLEPRRAVAHLNLGRARRARDDLPGALECFRRAADLEPRMVEPVAALADVYAAQGQPAEAIPLWEKALALAPNRATLHGGLADARHALGDVAGAVEAYGRAVALDERLASAWWGMGCAQLTLNHYAAAAESLGRAVALDQDHGEARHNLGRALFEIGQIDAALDAFRAVIARHGPNEMTLGMIATIIPGSPRASQQTILAERRTWAAHCAPSGPARTFANLRDAQRRPLRLGYVSSFFQHRNWMKPVWGLINHHDRAQFEIHLFSDAAAAQIKHGYRPDGRDQFHDITGLSNAEVADLIEREGIDLLIDLNGYSKLPRLPLFPMRPAPLVVSWFSLYATSGLSCFDALLVDEHVILAEEEPFCSEPVVRLPACYLTFEVGYPVPEVGPQPCLLRGQFTFGCLAPQYKITTEAVAAWSRILQSSSGSRLLLKNKLLGTPDTRRFMESLFARFDIPAERVILEGPDEHYTFLARYNDIDLALDTFPYNGGTTTEEALWQGVPVLTFFGDRWTSRISASIQRYAELTEFNAVDVDDYVRRAVTLANDPGTPARLDELRQTLRERVRRSSLGDVSRFARLIEGEYLRLWERWCAGTAGRA
jgi:predicted O-linked N-acetylglucosamine transferase (SPINDLY family)